MRWAVGGALVISVGVNAYLLFGTETAVHESPAKASTPAMEVPVQITLAERSTLEARLAAAEARLVTLRPLEQQFERNEPNPDAEARMQPHLARVFAGEEHTVACRGDICELTWTGALSMNDIQEAPGLEWMFDEVHASRRQALVRLVDPENHRGLEALTPLVSALFASPALAECKRANPTEGWLGMSVQIVASKYVVRAYGPFAEHAIGVCVRKAMEDVTAKLTPDIQNADPMSFPVPLG